MPYFVKHLRYVQKRCAAVFLGFKSLRIVSCYPMHLIDNEEWSASVENQTDVLVLLPWSE